MSSISSVNCDFLLVWRLFRNLMNTRIRNLTITSKAFGFGVKYPEPTTLDQIYEKGARVLKAVVFDMDETLLSINLNAFILRYFKDVSSMLADIGRRSRGGTMARLGTILVDLNANRRSGTDNRTNLEFYQEEVERRCGIRLSDPLIYEAFTYYDREVRPYRTQGCVVRSLPTPAFPRGPSSAAWVGATWPTLPLSSSRTWETPPAASPMPPTI